MNLIQKFGDPMKRSHSQALGLVLLIPIVLGWLVWHWVFARPSAPLTSDEALVEAVLISIDDLPESWNTEDIETEWPSIHNGIGKDIWFRRSYKQPWVNIRGGAYVYQDEDAARLDYQTQCSRFARYELQGWEAMPYPSFSHHADEMRSYCTEGYFNGEHHFACEVVGRYGRVVIIVGGNIFDTEGLTAEQFLQVLVAADQKANQSRAEQ